MASPPGYADDGFQFGEAARWLAFVAPYAAFASYVHAALSIKHGVLGFLEAFAVSLWTLPFWRAAHARPVFLPLTPLLARHHAKLRLPAFEDTSAEGVAADPNLAWVRVVEANVATFQAELAAFVDSQTVRIPSRRDDDDDDDASSARGDDDSSPSRPALRMHRSGLDSLPLCDVGLVRANAMARRHFPETAAIVASVGGFAARLWVLAPSSGGVGEEWRLPPRDDDGTRRENDGEFLPGVSDGYWRVHATLAADESAAAGVESESEAKKMPNPAAEALRRRARLRVGDAPPRGVEVGNVWVVNDLHRRAWTYDGGPIAGGAGGSGGVGGGGGGGGGGAGGGRANNGDGAGGPPGAGDADVRRREAGARRRADGEHRAQEPHRPRGRGADEGGRRGEEPRARAPGNLS